MKYLVILFLLLLVDNAYALTPFFTNGGFTTNGIEWCEENYLLYQYLGNDFFKHHKHSLESRICASLFLDPLWSYPGNDRIEKLVERSRYYVQLEVEESSNEAKTGIIDTRPASLLDDPPQEIIQQKKDKERMLSDQRQLENQTSPEKPVLNHTVDETDVLNYSLDELPFFNRTVVEDVNSNANQGGGCLIATATYGSEMAPQVQFLREIRDNKVMSTDSGFSFMNGFNQIYYSFSPYVADYERENPVFKELVKIGITPMLTSLSILSLANSEQEIVGLGIGVILMNIGMYFVAPTLIIYRFVKS